jgi:hypothetical protein
MKGSIINRPKGSNRWSIILEVRDETTGKRKRRWHSFMGTKRRFNRVGSRHLSAYSRLDSRDVRPSGRRDMCAALSPY